MKVRVYCVRSGGFTLVELLIVITILAIFAGQAIPSMTNLVDDARRKSVINDLIGAINLARAAAVTESTTVTLCPLDDSGSCTKDWTYPITVFRDPSRARQLTDASAILRQIDPGSGGTWHPKTANRRYFSFNSTGYARHAIGSVLWCPRSKDNTKASQILINMGGRPRLAQDSDGDGIVEDSQGSAVFCP